MTHRLLPLILAAFLGITACGEGAPDPVSQASEAVLRDLQGDERRISDWRGKVVLVNFWATWCAPCLREIPALQQARKEFGPRGFEVVGIAIDRQEAVRRFAEEHQIEYPVLDGEHTGMALMPLLGNDPGGLPFSVIFDRDGKIGYKHLGELTKSTDLSRYVL